MSLPLIESDVTEVLDFNPELPCEHHEHPSGMYGHSGPAKYLIRRFPHCPGGPGLILLCEGAWNHAGTYGLRCYECWHHCERDESWQIVEVLQ